MKLSKKKELAAKTLGVGKNRIVFKIENLSEIKEAITRQDIRSLKNEGIISIKPIKGRRKIGKRKSRKGPGKIKKKVNTRKQTYVKLTRKLRGYLVSLRDRRYIDRDVYLSLRKKIRMREFKSKSNMRDYLKNLNVNFDKVQENTDKVKRKIKSKDKEKKWKYWARKGILKEKQIITKD